jgi:hypothetical protein
MRIPAAAAVAPCHSSTGAKRVTSSGKKILICRSPGSGEPGPGTAAYVTSTHSHRRSCPASPGKPDPGAAAGAVAGFQRARRSLSASSPDVPAGRAQRQCHAGRASLAGGQVVRQASDGEVRRIPRSGLRRSQRPRQRRQDHRRLGGGWLPEIPLLTAGQAVADWLEAWTGRRGRNGSTLVVTIPGVPRFVGPADPSLLSGAPQFRCPRACGPQGKREAEEPRGKRSPFPPVNSEDPGREGE